MSTAYIEIFGAFCTTVFGKCCVKQFSQMNNSHLDRDVKLNKNILLKLEDLTNK